MSHRIVSALLFLCASGVLAARPAVAQISGEAVKLMTQIQKISMSPTDSLPPAPADGGPPGSIEHMRSELGERQGKPTLSPFGCRKTWTPPGSAPSTEAYTHYFGEDLLDRTDGGRRRLEWSATTANQERFGAATCFVPNLDGAVQLIELMLEAEADTRNETGAALTFETVVR